jgi:hypothetical protein
MQPLTLDGLKNLGSHFAYETSWGGTWRHGIKMHLMLQSAIGNPTDTEGTLIPNVESAKGCSFFFFSFWTLGHFDSRSLLSLVESLIEFFHSFYIP